MPSANRLKFVHFQQLFADRDNVDRLPFMIELHHRLENDLVAPLIKNLLAVITKNLDDLFNRIIFKQNAGKNFLLNFR